MERLPRSWARSTAFSASKLSELLGAMGITSILSANPLTGLASIAVTAYAYRKKRDESLPVV
jgi:hypothetical protein